MEIIPDMARMECASSAEESFLASHLSASDLENFSGYRTFFGNSERSDKSSERLNPSSTEGVKMGKWRRPFQLPSQWDGARWFIDADIPLSS